MKHLMLAILVACLMGCNATETTAPEAVERNVEGAEVTGSCGACEHPAIAAFLAARWADEERCGVIDSYEICDYYCVYGAGQITYKVDLQYVYKSSPPFLQGPYGVSIYASMSEGDCFDPDDWSIFWTYRSRGTVCGGSTYGCP